MALTFYFSEYYKQIREDDRLFEEYEVAQQDIEDKLGLEDWEFLCWHSGVNPFRGKCMKKIEEFKTRQQEEELKNSHIITMEELFTGDEMDEALKRILSDEQYRQKYENAPSDALREYYLLEECFVAHGEKEGVEGVLDGTATKIWQLQDAFTPEDWQYEHSNAADSAYKQRCIWKVSGKPCNRQGGNAMLKIGDYFTSREIFEAMKIIFKNSSYKRKYRGAPSEALRRYYLLDECRGCAVSTGKKYKDVEKYISGIKSQFEDALSIEDWEYEASNTYNSQYKYACRHRAKKLKARQEAEKHGIGTE
ncbi:MAG: hypothetical protein LUE27_06480 [Clostridia bacterium]|nr:hypothetical protein [Clostridia bacterium]